MSLVNVFVKTDDAVPVPVPGVVVSLVSTNPYAVAARITTDENGLAGFDVPDATYEIRAYRRGFILPVRSVSVQGDGAYDLVGTPILLAASSDPRTCFVTGRFVDIGNQPIAGVTVIVTPKGETGFQEPKVVDGQMVTSRSLYRKTSQDGLVSFELLRTGEFFITFSGDDDTSWNFKVPDRPSANLIDLIHPQPLSVAWGQPSADLTVAGGPVSIPVVIAFSDFQDRSQGVAQWLELSNSDPSVADVVLSRDQLLVTPKTAGTTTITGLAKDGIFPVRVPTYALSVPPLIVTVT